MVRYDDATSRMTYSDDQIMAALKGPPSPSAPLFKKAWTTALLGFVLLILSFALNIYFWMRWTKIVYGDYDIDEIRRLSWLNGVTGIANMIGIVLIVASIAFVIRGLLVDNNRWRAGTILIGTLKRLECVALIALMFYLLYVPILILTAFVLGSAYMLASYSNPAVLFLAAMPLIIAHALNKPPT